jgi:hypothetical protein
VTHAKASSQAPEIVAGPAVGYAPNWGALHLHWGEALDRLGDRAMAIEQSRKAEGLALSDADRLTVAHYLSTATR